MSDQTTRARLLVATPGMNDPNFDRSVVLMLEHGQEGALGVVLTNPTELAVSEALEDWAALAAPPEVVHLGGPVSPESVIGLAVVRLDDVGDRFTPVFGRVGVIDLGDEADDVRAGIEAVRVFAGYSGWSPGQLEGELAAGAWLVVDAHVDDVITDRPDELWEAVLRRQGGRLARLADYPLAPWLN